MQQELPDTLSTMRLLSLETSDCVQEVNQIRYEFISIIFYYIYKAIKILVIKPLTIYHQKYMFEPLFISIYILKNENLGNRIVDKYLIQKRIKLSLIGNI